MLEKVQFPMLTLRAQPADKADDAIVLGAPKAGCIAGRRPPRWARPSSAGQPGNLAAQFGCYYDDQVGLFTAALDGARLSQNHYLPAEHGRSGDVLDSTRFRPHGCTGKTIDLVLTTFHGADAATPPDWRDAADLYKQWAVRQPWCAGRLPPATTCRLG